MSSIKRDDPDATAKSVDDGTPERVHIYHPELTLDNNKRVSVTRNVITLKEVYFKNDKNVFRRLQGNCLSKEIERPE